jgi:polysaccharide export outer membrane protein
MGSNGRSHGRRSCEFAVRALAAALALAFAPAGAVGVVGVVELIAQAGPAARAAFTDYVVGPQDVLTITSYDQADLSGKFAIEADGTFTYPLIGRVKAGGLTLGALEGAIKQQLKDEDYFRIPR